jgi:3-(3-hydroxy-phenyl)propionate hydroxylase
VPGLAGFIRGARMKPAPRFRRGAYLGLPRRGWRGVEGTLAPQPPVRTCDGRPLRLDEALGLGFALLGYGVDPRGALRDEDLNMLRQLGTRFITVYPAGGRPQGRPGEWRADRAELADIEDHTGALTRWFAKARVPRGGTILLRPDRFVFGAAAPAGTDSLVAELRRQLAVSPVQQLVSHESAR